MDQRIERLPYTDEATKVVLQELVEKKEKLDKVEWDYRFHVFLCLGLAFLLLYSLYKTMNQFEVIEFSSFQQLFSANYFNLAVLVILVIDFCWVKVLKNKHTKVETEFHQLRIEVVDKAKDIWRDESWKGRGKVFQVLNDEFDINLFFESK